MCLSLEDKYLHLLLYLTLEIKFWKTLYFVENTLTNGSTMPVPVSTPKLRQKWRAARQVVAFLRPQKSMQAELQPTIRTAITTPKAPYVASVLNWKERRQLNITQEQSNDLGGGKVTTTGSEKGVSPSPPHFSEQQKRIALLICQSCSWSAPRATSVLPEATHKARLRALEGRWSQLSILNKSLLITIILPLKLCWQMELLLEQFQAGSRNSRLQSCGWTCQRSSLLKTEKGVKI